MLHAVDPDLSARPRTATEQHAVTQRLTEIGIATPVAYPAGSADTVDMAVPSGRTLAAVLADPDSESAVVNAMVLRHYELVTRAHDRDIVLGDRFPHRAVVTERTELHLVHLDVAYVGPEAAQALAEEALCVVATVAAIHPGHCIRADLLDRLVAAMGRRHGEASAVPVLHRAASHLSLVYSPRGGAPYRTDGNRLGGVPDTSDGVRAAILSLAPPAPADTRQPARPA